MNDLTFSLNRALSLSAKLNDAVDRVPDAKLRDLIEDVHHELCKAKFNLSGVMGETNSLRRRLNGDGRGDSERSEPVLFNGCIDM